MNEIQQLKRLFNYDRWSNRQILDALRNHTDFAERPDAVRMFHHILNAARQWYRRIRGDHPTDLSLWPDRTELGDAGTKLEKLTGDWQELIQENEDNLSRTIQYQNSSGTTFQNQLSDLLHHVIIHGQHHRAQIAKMLRRGEITPPETDFIFYLRDRS